MRLANVRFRGEDRVAVEEGGFVLLPSRLFGRPVGATDDLLGMWGPGLAEAIAEASSSGEMIDPGEAAYRPAVTCPQKILCIGDNYRRHIREMGKEVPTAPVVFGKFANALAAHLDPIALPRASRQVDYEAELALVIGRRAHHVREEEALGYVFGCTVANDVSARDLQLRTSQWLPGKSCDHFAPIGPSLVTLDEVGDPNDLRIRLWLNGELRQDASTGDMVFRCERIVSELSSYLTLLPGDVILTGTPSGVIVGKAEAERRWLAPGDRTVATVERVGSLENTFVSEG